MNFWEIHGSPIGWSYISDRDWRGLGAIEGYSGGLWASLSLTWGVSPRHCPINLISGLGGKAEKKTPKTPTQRDSRKCEVARQLHCFRSDSLHD